MILEPAPEPLVDTWAKRYREEAEKDGFSLWREPDGSNEAADSEDPLAGCRMRLERQIELVKEMARQHAFGPDGGPEAIEAFLRHQTYHPERSDARYVVHVAGGDGPPATLYAEGLEQLDIVELLGSHGYRSLAVGLRDPKAPLEPFELDELEQQILDDLYFDFDEEGVSVSFERFEFGVLAHVARVFPGAALEGGAAHAPELEAEIRRWQEKADALLRAEAKQERTDEA